MILLPRRSGAVEASRRMKEPEDREFVTALARGLSVIQVFGREHAELTLSEVAQRAALSPATARRCLRTLQRLGYVGQAGNRFCLRPKILSLGSSWLDAARVEEVIVPLLREVVSETGDSSSVAILDGDEVLYVANFSAKRLVRLTAGVGARFPAYAVSMGRVLLAALPAESLDAYLARLDPEPLTPQTVTDKAALRAIIDAVRRDGCVAVKDELEDGLGAVAVPVRGKDGRVLASLNCSAFSPRLTIAEMVAARRPVLERMATEIGQAISRVPALLHSLG
jgi:IclR family pca regulon transcriptional regulator